MTNMGKLETPATGLPTTAIEITAISFLVLFQELTLIRWLPGQVRVLAYFPNLILIAAFLGLGLGCLVASRRSLLWLWPTSLLGIVVATVAMSHIAFTQESVTEHLWLLYMDLPQNAPVIHSVHPPIIVAFIMSAITFIPLGQLLAVRLETFRLRSSSLWGYCWDLLGSLWGVIFFSLFGFFGLFPWTWFAAVFLIGFIFYCNKSTGKWIYALLALVIVICVHQGERAQVYSPYYAISQQLVSDSNSFKVLTNGSFHQHAHPLANSDELDDSWGLNLREGYHFPYRQLMEKPGHVLVLGAGTGNDVAVLLDEGASRIDAVEIDPVILQLGFNHPNRPYDSPKVRIFNTDARSYLNDTQEVYDLIVFGTLDSMTRLSALSNVRLDNYVYTRECIEAARSRLKDGGGMVMYFMVVTDYIDQRLIGLVASAFGEVPLIRTRNSSMFNRILIAGAAFDHLRSHNPEQRRVYFEEILPTIQIPTDDWPYLYLKNRSISRFYLSLIFLFAAISAGAVFLVSREMRSSLLSGRGPDWEMFLFGVGFLLIETKFITAMNLIWGATWLTSAVVFGSVLLMILISTVVMELKPINWWIAASGLVFSLLATYFIPIRLLLVENVGLRLLYSLAFVGVPVFFAAACFAMRFRERRSAGLAFGWNLLGAVTGGLLEFLSMVIGLKALSLVAVIAYLGALLIRSRRDRRSQPGPAAPEPKSACPARREAV